MKVRYIGPSKGILSPTDGKVYECLGVEYGFLRVIDDEGYGYWEKEPDEKEGYLYPPAGVLVNEDGSRTGRFEIVEDDAQSTLHQLFQNNSESINTAGKKGERHAAKSAGPACFLYQLMKNIDANPSKNITAERFA